MKRNLSTCFFKKGWAHYSFGQMLISGVLALAITSSTIGATAVAAVTLQAASGSSVSQSSSSSSMVEATPAPTAEPEKEINTEFFGMAWYASSIGEPEEIEPDIEVVLSTGGSQQKLSVGVYAEMEDENGYTWNEIIIGVPMMITIVCDELAELENEDYYTGHAASVVGAISIYDINTSSGTFQLGEIDPGEYTVTLSCEYDNYIMPDPVTVTVVEKITYEVDDTTMKDEEAGYEDNGEQDTTVVEDTVRYVDSSSTSEDYTLYVLTEGEYWTSSKGDKYFKFTLDGGTSYYQSAYKITTATTTIDGVEYEYYVSATLDTSLTIDGDGVASESTSSSSSSSTASTTSSSTASSASSTMQLSTNYDNANFSGLTPLSLSVGSGASTGKAYSTINTLSTVTTTTLVVSSDSTSYGFMTINEEDAGSVVTEPAVTYYTVTYTDGLDDGTTYQSTDVEAGGDTPTCSDPTRTGYEFTGWDKDVASTVTENVTYNATWKDVQTYYTVTYTDGLEGGTIYLSEEVVAGSGTPTCSDPTREGYEFTGWDKDVASTVIESVTYNATWQKVQSTETYYTVTYTDGVDDVVVFADESSSVVAEGATPGYSGGTPTREGYTFAAWSPAVATTVTADVTYTATWTANASSDSSSSTTTDTSTWTQTVTLYSNGAASNSSVTVNGKSYTAASLFGISADTVTVYTYSGWQTVNNIRYYYDPDTNKPVTGTQIINGTTYEFGSNGAFDSQCTGIDVSYWNGTIDWDKVKAAGVEFVIIRAGYRGYSSGTIVQDVNFTTYITGAQAAGLRVGIYFFSQAINAQEGVEEASACINLIKAYGTSYPIYIDTELSGASGNTGRADNISNADRTAAVVAFCETIKSAGYTPGIYASYSWFTSKLNFSEVSGYSLWNAQWGSTNSMSSAGMWQYTSDGSVNGISGRVDMNVSYIG